MSAAAGRPVAALPRWLVVAVTIAALLAIGTGMGAPARPPEPVSVVAAADSTFPAITGFMMDSLRRGRFKPDTTPAQVPIAKPPARRGRAAVRDSVAPHYSPRGCMPD